MACMMRDFPLPLRTSNLEYPGSGGGGGSYSITQSLKYSSTQVLSFHFNEGVRDLESPNGHRKPLSHPIYRLSSMVATIEY